MKKIWLICMSLVLVFSLSACQNSSNGPSTETKTDVKALPQGHSVEAIGERAELIIALPGDSYSIYIAPNSSEYHGYNAEFAKLLASEIGVKATFVNKSSIDETLNSVEKGEADIAVSNFNRTPERLERFSVSDNYSFMDSGKDSIFVLSENSKKFNTKDKLNNAKIAVVLGAAQTEQAKKNFPNATYLEFSTGDECWKALKSGEVDVIIAPIDVNSNTASEDFKRAWNNKTVVESEYTLEDTYNGRGYLMMKGNSSLTNKVNELIKRCLDDGSYERWYNMYIKEVKKLGY